VVGDCTLSIVYTIMYSIIICIYRGECIPIPTNNTEHARNEVDASSGVELYLLYFSIPTTLPASQAMSDPVVEAMGDEKLKDIDGIEEKPEEVAEAATHPNITEKEATDVTSPSTPAKVCPPCPCSTDCR
jgi:hypothetical protein